MTTTTTAREPRCGERPIIMTGESARAILAGRKTQTRRVMSRQPWLREGRMNWSPQTARHDPTVGHTIPRCVWNPAVPVMETGAAGIASFCPYGVPGDRLWVRETWAMHPDNPENGVLYRATDPGWDDNQTWLRWRSPIHMPRQASRLLLKVVAVRVERLQEMDRFGARAEGVDRTSPNLVAAYRSVWDRINGKRHPWSSNPWVWVVKFRPAAGAAAVGGAG